MKKNVPIEYKVQIKQPDENQQEQIFFNSVIDKNVLLNFIKKKKSFNNTNINEIMNNLKIKSNDDNSIQKSNVKRTNTVLNFKYSKINLLKIQTNGKIINELKHRSSKEICKIKRTLSVKTQ